MASSELFSINGEIVDKNLYVRDIVHVSKVISQKGLHYSNRRINLTRKDMTNALH